MASSWGVSWGTSWAHSWDGVAAPAPPAGPGGGPGGRYLTRERYQKEIVEVRRAREEALERAEEENARAKAALEQAAAASQRAVEAAVDTNTAKHADLQRLTDLLESAARADKVAKTVAQANLATIAANAMVAKMREEEDEAIALLLLS